MRTLLALSLVLGLAACGGGSTGTSTPSTGYVCDPGTQVTLARPFSGQTGVSTSTNSIEIVANGNTGTLYNSYQNWNLYLVPQYGYGGQIVTSSLSLTSDKTGPQPYPSDYYYSATFTGGLAPGTVYSVYLNANTNCQPVGVGSFST